MSHPMRRRTDRPAEHIRSWRSLTLALAVIAMVAVYLIRHLS